MNGWGNMGTQIRFTLYENTGFEVVFDINLNKNIKEEYPTQPLASESCGEL